MPNFSYIASANVKALLYEIRAALTELKEHKKTKLIFLNKMALSQEEIDELTKLLGYGSIRIEMNNTDEPVKWQESGISGVWFGLFFDQSENVKLETLEICYFPELAAVQPEDLERVLTAFQIE